MASTDILDESPRAARFHVYAPDDGPSPPHRWRQVHVHQSGLVVTIRHIVVPAEEWPGMPESQDAAWVPVRHAGLMIAYRSDS